MPGLFGEVVKRVQLAPSNLEGLAAALPKKIWGLEVLVARDWPVLR